MMRTKSYTGATEWIDDGFKKKMKLLANELPDKGHVWEAMLPIDLYNRIKKFLLDIPDMDAAFDLMPGTDFLKIVKFFVGEWWKREYHDNCPIVPAFKTGQYQKVVEVLGIEHQKVNVRTMWQDTLFAEGGIPVYDLVNKFQAERKTDLADNLTSLYECEGELDADITETLFANRTINRSKSIRDFIPYLQNGSMPYVEDELINSNSTWKFSDFTEALSKAFDNHMRKKFSIEYRMWMIDGFKPSLNTFIRFKPDFTGMGRNYAVSQERLSYWGAQTDLNGFRIAFKSGDSELCVPFFKCVNGDWVPLTADNTIKTQFPFFANVSYEIRTDAQIFKKELIEGPAKGKGFVQMFSQDGANWTSYGTCGKFSIALFDPNIWNAANAFQLAGTDLEYIIISDDGGTIRSNTKKDRRIDFNNAEGQLMVRPSRCLFTEGWFTGKTGYKYECKISGKDDGIPAFVTDRLDFDFNIQAEDRRSGTYRWTHVKPADVSVAVLDQKSGRYFDISKDTILKGYHNLRFRAKGKETKIDCFFLPKGTDIIRLVTTNSSEGTIELTGEITEDKSFKISLDNAVSLNINNSGKISCSHQLTGASSHCKIVFQDKDGYMISVGTAWPYDCSDILRITETGTELHNADSVPTVFADRFLHRTFSKSGIVQNKISDDGRYAFGDVIMRGILNDSRNPVEVDGCQFALYDREITKDDRYQYIIVSGNTIKVDIEQLKFYFIPEKDGEPVELHLEHIINEVPRGPKEYLVLNLPDEIGEYSGMIVQSLEGLVPNMYFRPRYKPSAKETTKLRPDDKKRKQSERINSYFSHPGREDEGFAAALRAFKLASRLGCHYAWFDEIKGLCAYDQALESRLATFFEKYANDSSTRHKAIDYTSLWRLTEEFLLDWTLFPSYVWTSLCEKDSELFAPLIEKLFCSRPGIGLESKYKMAELSKAILNHGDMKFRRTADLSATIAKCLRGKKNYVFSSLKDKKTRIELLKAMNNPDVLENVIQKIKE